MRYTNKDDNADSRCILGKAKSNVAMEKRLPAFCRRKEDGEQHCTYSPYDSVKKSGERESVMSALELLDGFMKINYTIKKREDFG